MELCQSRPHKCYFIMTIILIIVWSLLNPYFMLYIMYIYSYLYIILVLFKQYKGEYFETRKLLDI